MHEGTDNQNYLFCFLFFIDVVLGMANKAALWIIGGAVTLYLVLKSSKAAAGTNNIPMLAAPQGSSFNLGALNYTSDSVTALQNLYNVLLSAVNPDNGQGLTTLQQQLMLTQALGETGIFTDSPNWNAVNANNFAGIFPPSNGAYPAGNGTQLANFPDIPTFVNYWLMLLTKNTDPLEATGANDFINKLLSSGYIVNSDVPLYQQWFPTYFNLLNSIAQ